MGPELRGERIALVRLRPADAARLAEFHARNRAHLAPWSPPQAKELESEEGCRARLLKSNAEAEAGTALRLHLVSLEEPAGEILGHASLSQIFRGPFLNAYLGYAIGREWEGRGLMTEALRLLVAHAFGPLELHRLQANHVPENARSARVLKRLGFRKEGLAKDYLFIGGAWRDHVMTALLNPDHPGPP